MFLLPSRRAYSPAFRGRGIRARISDNVGLEVDAGLPAGTAEYWRYNQNLRRNDTIDMAFRLFCATGGQSCRSVEDFVNWHGDAKKETVDLRDWSGRKRVRLDPLMLKVFGEFELKDDRFLPGVFSRIHWGDRMRLEAFLAWAVSPRARNPELVTVTIERILLHEMPQAADFLRRRLDGCSVVAAKYGRALVWWGIEVGSVVHDETAEAASLNLHLNLVLAPRRVRTPAPKALACALEAWLRCSQRGYRGCKAARVWRPAKQPHAHLSTEHTSVRGIADYVFKPPFPADLSACTDTELAEFYQIQRKERLCGCRGKFYALCAKPYDKDSSKLTGFGGARILRDEDGYRIVEVKKMVPSVASGGYSFHPTLAAMHTKHLSLQFDMVLLGDEKPPTFTLLFETTPYALDLMRHAAYSFVQRNPSEALPVVDQYPDLFPYLTRGVALIPPLEVLNQSPSLPLIDRALASCLAQEVEFLNVEREKLPVSLARAEKSVKKLTAEAVKIRAAMSVAMGANARQRGRLKVVESALKVEERQAESIRRRIIAVTTAGGVQASMSIGADGVKAGAGWWDHVAWDAMEHVGVAARALGSCLSLANKVTKHNKRRKLVARMLDLADQRRWWLAVAEVAQREVGKACADRVAEEAKAREIAEAAAALALAQRQDVIDDIYRRREIREREAAAAAERAAQWQRDKDNAAGNGCVEISTTV